MRISEMTLEELKAYQIRLKQHLEAVVAEMRSRIENDRKHKSNKKS